MVLLRSVCWERPDATRKDDSIQRCWYFQCNGCARFGTQGPAQPRLQEKGESIARPAPYNRQVSPGTARMPMRRQRLFIVVDGVQVGEGQHGAVQEERDARTAGRHRQPAGGRRLERDRDDVQRTGDAQHVIAGDVGIQTGVEPGRRPDGAGAVVLGRRGLRAVRELQAFRHLGPVGVFRATAGWRWPPGCQ